LPVLESIWLVLSHAKSWWVLSSEWISPFSLTRPFSPFSEEFIDEADPRRHTGESCQQSLLHRLYFFY
jgi:hypothetical protein